MTETPDWFYFAVALMLYFAVYYCVEYALRPKPREGHDWFWGPDSDGWVEVKPEQNARQQSKPTSGAG